MATISKVYDSSFVRDYNTTNIETDVSGAPISQEITANVRVPGRYLTNDPEAAVAATNSATYPFDTVQGSGVINDVSEITTYRFTFEVDEDNEVIPGSTIIMEYSTDFGVTFSNFFDDTDLEEAGYLPYQALFDEGVDTVNDGSDWIAIGAFNSTNGNVTGFVLKDDGPVAPGDVFVTNDPLNPSNPLDPFGNQTSEFLGICFTAGMKLEAENGPIAVEDLQVGDLVKTLDHGLQPIRAIFSRKHPRLGKMRPVVFEKWAIGNDAPVIVSQKHRFLVSTLPDEIRRRVIGSHDVLIQAVELINNSTIRMGSSAGEVEYFHIMFDQHELVYCAGTVSESWQPHRKNLGRDKEVRDELLAIFPEIRFKNSNNSGAQVRPEISLNQERLYEHLRHKLK